MTNTNIDMSELIKTLDNMDWCDIYDQYVFTLDAIAEYYPSEIVEDYIYGGETETNERIEFSNGLIMLRDAFTGNYKYEFSGGGWAEVWHRDNTGVFVDLYGVRHYVSDGSVKYGIIGAGTVMYWANYEEFISEYKAYSCFS